MSDSVRARGDEGEGVPRLAAAHFLTRAEGLTWTRDQRTPPEIGVGASGRRGGGGGGRPDFLNIVRGPSTTPYRGGSPY